MNAVYVVYAGVKLFIWGFRGVSEFTPFPGVNSDTKTCLVSRHLYIRLLQKCTKPRSKYSLAEAKNYANVSNPSEITPVDGTFYRVIG